MENKKKILYTSHTANFHKFNRPYMRMMHEKGWEVHYASANEEKIYDTDKVFAVDFARSPFRFDKHIKAYRQLTEILRTNNYRVIHTHTPVGSVITRLAARKLRKEGGCKVIYTAHGFHFYTGASKLNWILWYPIEKIMAHFTDDIIVINTEDYERAKAKLKTRVHYTPGVGVDPEKFSFVLTEKEKAELKKSLGLNPTDFVMSYVAEINSNKNHEKILRDFRDYLRLSNVHFLFIGEGKLSDKLMVMARQYGIEDHIHLLGYRTDVPKLLKITNLYISASKREGLGLNILEARRSGCPVLCTENRGHRDAMCDLKTFDYAKTLDNTYGIYTTSVNTDDKGDLVDALTQMTEIYRA